MYPKKILGPGAIVKNNGKAHYLSGATGPMTQPQTGLWNVYAPDFSLKDRQPWWSYKHINEIDLESADPEGLSFVEPDFVQFEEQYNKFQEGFRGGSLKKIVPVVFSTSSVGAIESFILKRLSFLSQNQSEALIPYGMWSKVDGIIGLTPELLFKVEGRKLTTMALAGTAHGTYTSDPAFFSDPKENAEHDIVVNSLVEQLSSFGKVAIGKKTIHRLPLIKHLKTSLEVELNDDIDFEQIVQKLHPTPALGVYPNDQLEVWEEELSPGFDRRRYGAPFGWIDPQGNFECYVAIRNIQWMNSSIFLGSGCGIVPESDLGREWDELRMKRDHVRGILGL